MKFETIITVLLGIFVLAWIIVNLSGEFNWRNRNVKNTLLVMAVIFISLPTIGFIIN